MNPKSREADYVVICGNDNEINTILSYFRGKKTKFKNWKFIVSRNGTVRATNKVIGKEKKLPFLNFCEWENLASTVEQCDSGQTEAISAPVGAYFYETGETTAETKEEKDLIVDPEYLGIFDILVRTKLKTEADSSQKFSKNDEIVVAIENLGFMNVFKSIAPPSLPILKMIPYTVGEVIKEGNRTVFKYGNLLFNRTWFLGNSALVPVVIKLSNGQTIGSDDVGAIRDYLRDVYQHEQLMQKQNQ